MIRYTQKDEEISHSEFGIVKNEECLLRLLFDPEHMKDGIVLETAISGQDLKERGFSLDRCAYVDIEIIKQRIDDQTAKNPDKRQTNSIARFICGSARNLLDEANERFFIVIDDEIPGNKAHSLLYSAKENLSKSALKKLKEQLLPFLQEGLGFNPELGCRKDSCVNE